MNTTTFPHGEALGASMKFVSACNAAILAGGDPRNPQPSHALLLVSSTGVEMRRFEFTPATGLRRKGVNKGVSLTPSRRTLKKRAARAERNKKSR